MLASAIIPARSPARELPLGRPISNKVEVNWGIRPPQFNPVNIAEHRLICQTDLLYPWSIELRDFDYRRQGPQ